MCQFLAEASAFEPGFAGLTTLEVLANPGLLA
jgi:hypothetical protein